MEFQTEQWSFDLVPLKNRVVARWWPSTPRHLMHRCASQKIDPPMNRGFLRGS